MARSAAIVAALNPGAVARQTAGGEWQVVDRFLAVIGLGPDEGSAWTDAHKRLADTGSRGGDDEIGPGRRPWRGGLVNPEAW